MANELSLFDQAPTGNLPTHLAAFSSGLSTDLMLGGAGRNRLGLKGNRFRLIVSGQEEAVLESTSMEVIIVGASKGVGRLYFGGDYDPDKKSHPLCYSADGVTPGADVVNPQSMKCANCPQNQKGSKITADGTKTKACTYFKRLAVTPMVDPEHRVFQLDGKAMSIFGEGEPARNLFTLNEYAKKLNIRGFDVAHLVTKITFDVNSSVSEDVKTICTVSAITDASDAVSEEEPAQTEAPAQVVQKAPVAAPKPVQAKPTVVKAATSAPAAAAPAVKATIIKATPAPAAAQVAEVAPAEDEELAAFLSQLDSVE